MKDYGTQIKEKVKGKVWKDCVSRKFFRRLLCSGECSAVTKSISVTTYSPVQIAKNIGYDTKELESIPESSILGVGCGVPVNFADIHEGEVVVDIGSGGGIDVFLSAKKVKDSGKVIGIDMTDEMLEKATKYCQTEWIYKCGIQKRRCRKRDSY